MKRTNQITELLELHTSLEGKLEFGSLDDDIGEIKKMDFERIQHTLTGDDNLLRLFFDRERSNEGSDFFGCLPLGELTETLLSSPNRRVNDLDERLSSSRIEDKDSSVDRLSRQISFESLVDGDTVNLSIVHEPNAEEEKVGSEMNQCKIEKKVTHIWLLKSSE